MAYRNENGFIRPTNTTVTATTTGTTTGDNDRSLLDKRAIQELIKQVDPMMQIDEEVEDMLIQIAEEFVDSTLTASCQNAKHRKSNTVETKDVQLYLERTYSMWIPGFGTEDPKQYKKILTNDALKAFLKAPYVSSTANAKSSNAKQQPLFSWIKNRNKSNSIRSNFSLCSLKTFINCITCFGGGIFLGICLLDLLPEVIHHVDTTIKNEFQYDNQTLRHYPIAEFLIGCGIFLVLSIEQIILSFRTVSIHSIAHMNKKPPIIMSHEDDETSLTTIDDHDPLMNKNLTIEHHFEISEHKDDIVTNKNRLLITRNFILVFSLIIHSIFEGITLASTNEYNTFIELFVAIIIHKSIISFSVGLKLMYMKNKRLVYFGCFLISIATPIGMYFVISMQELLPENRIAKIFNEILRAFACGTFFYITFFDVLPNELNMSTNHRHNSSNIPNRCRIVKVICVFIGFSFIGLLSFVMK
ncbi:unnamed protein product [Rotaria sp. Silwood2]|nr:unnamed protein product [Rotaria sp. Silwood2]